MNGKLTLLIASTLLGLSLLTGCSEPVVDSAANQPVAVKLYTVSADQQAQNRHFIGRIDAVSTVDLAFQVAGRVSELPVQQGQIIPAGTLLAALDPTDYQLALQQAQVQLAQAERDVTRAKPLREKGILTPSAFDQLQTNYDIAKVALQNAQRNAEYTQLTAPFDALVTRRLIERYSTVAPGTPILRVQNVSELRVHINVPEQIMRQVQDRGDYAVYVSLSDAEQTLYPLTYREHATEVDPLTQTYQVSFAMPRLPEVNLLPGMTVNVLTEKRGASASVFIPVSALDTSVAEQFSVWRYHSDKQHVLPIPVRVGRIREQHVEILSGLKQGDQVVAAGIYHLQPGQQVRPFAQY